MVLKEAFRYQNYLSSLIREAKNYLNKRDFITTTKQEHNRNKVNPEADNETVEVKSPYNVEFTPMQLVNFIMKAIAEKEKLSASIVSAKRSVDFDIDAALEMNREKQQYITSLEYLDGIRSISKNSRGQDYRFDNNGEQKLYYYPMTEIVTINYDRNNIRGLIKKLRKETDEVSTKLDLIKVNTEVDYTPIWDILTPLEEVVLS